MTIKIDLNDLTIDHVKQCAPHMGLCNYASPCIIGTLIPEDQREELNKLHRGSPTIGQLIDGGVIATPEGQRDKMIRLQDAFDAEDREGVETFLKQELGLDTRGVAWEVSA